VEKAEGVSAEDNNSMRVGKSVVRQGGLWIYPGERRGAWSWRLAS
jgi:ribosomal protein L27